ncbi:MAG: hypothetical protein HWN67_07395 [Candidatus Helarchaeota archaeon]|nr:hypothetical protein [Candidatus Helarchaeota archaeon]
MLSRIRKIFSPKTNAGNDISIQECPTHGKTVYLDHMINSRCALCDGYSREELLKIIKRIKAKES